MRVVEVTGGSPFVLERADLIVWSLKGMLPLQQRLIVDLHLRLTAKSSKLSELKLDLPFDVYDVGSDIEDLLQRKSFPLWLSHGERQSASGSVGYIDKVALADGYEPLGLKIVKFESEGRMPVPIRLRRSSRVSSTCVLQLTSGLEREHHGLISLRFQVAKEASFIVWKRSGLGINGMIFDTEVRQLGDNKFIHPKEGSISFIVPVWMQYRYSLPAVEVAIVPRDGELDEYLARKTSIGKQTALRYSHSLQIGDAVKPGAGVNSSVGSTNGIQSDNSRLALYLDVSREFGLLPIGNFLRLILTLVIILWLSQGLEFGKLVPTPALVASTIWSHVNHFRISLPGALYVGLVGLALFILERLGVIRSVWRSMCHLGRKIERFLLRP